MSSIVSADEIIQKTRETFGITPCKWQIEAVRFQLVGDHLLVIVATGGGKTVPFWIPLLFEPESVLFVITPLNSLAEQHAKKLNEAGFAAIAFNAESNRSPAARDFVQKKYRAIILSPEYALTNTALLEYYSYLGSKSVKVRLIIDEAHTVLAWTSFRKLFNNLSTLKFFLPIRTTYYLTSASLTSSDVKMLLNNLAISPKSIRTIKRSNDRPNLTYTVRTIEYTQQSKQDLHFLIPPSSSPDSPPKKFLVYFQSKMEAERACMSLRGLVPDIHKEKIIYFHADMCRKWQGKMIEAIQTGEIWGACASDSLGMGIDIPNISIIVQWKAAHVDMNTVIQRFGRGGRDLESPTLCVLLVEPEFTDKVREERRVRQLAVEMKKNERLKSVEGGARGTRKRKCLEESSSSANERNVRARLEVTCLANSGVLNQETAKNFDENERIHVSDDALTTNKADSVEKSVNPEEERMEPQFKQARSNAPLQLTIDPALDAFINAGQGRPFACRRAPVNELYGNLEAGSDTVSPCCKRCNPRPPTRCCDLCDPTVLEFFNKHPEVGETEKPVRKFHQTGKLKIMDNNDKRFKCDLEKWRDKIGIERFGADGLCDGSYLMHDDVINRIVQLRAQGKNQDLVAFQERCKWGLWSRYGARLFTEIIQPSFKVTSTTTKLANSLTSAANGDGVLTDTTSTNGIVKKARTVTCSHCKGEGHNINGCKAARSAGIIPKARKPRTKKAKVSLNADKENVVSNSTN